ncbi:MAG TPA: serine protease [Thiobacillaceae bacterium]|nr:serine protease [Thiobacillaceae bacterium]
MLLGFVLALPARADVADTLVRIKPAIVGIGTYQPGRSPGGQLKGTGFVVGDGRTVATCYHIVKPLLDLTHNETWAVFLGQGREVHYRVAKVLATDPSHDLALLRFEGAALPTLKLEDTQQAREGEQLYFTGYPIGSILGLYAATHRAGLAAIVPIYTPVPRAAELNARTIRQAYDPFRIFQLDAIAYPGNSGSPLWQPETGAVLGVVNSVFVKGAKEAALTNPSGISFAIPADHVRALMDRAGMKD